MFSLYQQRRITTSRSNKELTKKYEENLKVRQKQKRSHLSQASDTRRTE